MQTKTTTINHLLTKTTVVTTIYTVAPGNLDEPLEIFQNIVYSYL